MVALSAVSGDVLWELETGEAINGGALYDDGTLFFGSANGSLYAVDAAGGGLMWQHEAGGDLDSTPAVNDDVVVFSNAVGEAVSLDRETGEPLWSHADDDPILRVTRGLHPPVKGQSSPVIVEDVALAGFPSGRLSALALSDGHALWTVDLARRRVIPTSTARR
jgi:outer membrane protein assembly factor BamB